jgi:hypothetical protein
MIGPCLTYGFPAAARVAHVWWQCYNAAAGRKIYIPEYTIKTKQDADLPDQVNQANQRPINFCLFLKD